MLSCTNGKLDKPDGLIIYSVCMHKGKKWLYENQSVAPTISNTFELRASRNKYIMYMPLGRCGIIPKKGVGNFSSERRIS